MGIHERIEAELRKIVKPEDLESAKNVRADFLAIAEGMGNEELKQNGNLINILLSDQKITEKQAYYVMERAGANQEQTTSIIKARESIARAIGSLQAAKETMIMTNKNVEDLDIYEDKTIQSQTEKSIGKTVPKKTLAKTSQPKAPVKAGKTAKSRYTDFKLIGEGGMGCVYKVMDTLMGRTVAMKTIRPEITGERLVNYLARFKNEVQATAVLEDERIVRAYDVGKGTKGQIYMTMEFVKGESLDDILEKVHLDKKEYLKQLERREKEVNENLKKVHNNLERNAYASELEQIEKQREPEELQKIQKQHEEYNAKYQVRELMRLFEEACRAVAFANKKYIHRDIKPANIMIKQADGKEPNKAKLMDFGVAIAADGPEPKFIEGTPHYMGPEQAKAEKQSPLYDVYSLGATLYKILTGKQPFEGEDAKQILMKIVSKNEAMHPSKISRGLKEKPPELCEIAMKAINKDASLRYQTADELADDIRAWLDYKPTTAYTETRKEWLIRNDKRRPWVKYAAGIMAGITALGLAIGAPVLYISESKARQKTEQAQIEKQKADEAKIAENQAKQDKEKAQEEERKAKEAKEQSEREQAAKAEKRRLAMNEYNAGIDALKFEDYETAEKRFYAALEIDDVPDAHYEIGLRKYFRLESRGAVKEFEKANEASIRDANKTHLLANFYAALVNIELLDDIPRAIEHTRKIPKTNDYYSKLSQSIIAFAEKEYKKAITLADEATGTNPKRWEALLLSALYRMQGIGGAFNAPELLEYRDYEKALTLLSTALQRNPGQLRCLERRITLYCEFQKTAEALADAELLINNHPKVALFKTMRGYVQNFMKKYEESLESLIEAEQQGDKSATNYSLQSQNYLALGIKHPEQSASLYRKAESCLTKAIEKEEFPFHYAQRGLVRIYLEEFDGAIADANEALKKDPKNAAAYYLIGLYYKCRFNDNSNAIKNLEKSAELGYPVAHIEKARIHLTSNNIKEAIKSLHDYIATKNLAYAEEAKKMLRELEGK